MTDKKFPTEIIDLPSHGWFYPQESALSSGQVELKYLTAREEDILTSTNLIQKGVVLDKLLDSLIVSKDVNSKELLIGDKNGLLIAARIMGYGAEYPISVTCPACNITQEFVVKLTDLGEKSIEEPKEKGKNEFTFNLPFSKRVITFKLLTQKDEDLIEKELESIRKAGVSEIDKSLTTRLKYTILSIDGDASLARVRTFVDNEFLARDRLAFRDYYEKINPNIIMRTMFKCNNKVCEHETEVAIPIGLQFFWPDART